MARRHLHSATGLVFMFFPVLILMVLGSPQSNGAATRVPTPTPSPTPAPGSIAGNVFVDLNRDGKWYTVNEPGLAGVTVRVGGLSVTTAGAWGAFKLTSLPGNKTYSVQVIPPAGYVAPVASQVIRVGSGQSVTGVQFSLIKADTPTATASPSATASATRTETPTATPAPSRTPASTPTPSATIPSSATPTSTMCPQTTPEPLWVEPVISPTDLLAQTLIVRIGNGDAVTVTAESGVFTATGSFSAYGNPAAVELRLLPDAAHHLSVEAHVRPITWGGCAYGNYTLRTDRDRSGKPLVIEQITSPATPTPTATLSPTPIASSTPTPTVTPQPQRRHYLPLILR